MTTDKAAVYPAIPLDAGRVEGWKDVPITATRQDDPLVPLGLLSRKASHIMTSAVYFGEHTNSPYAAAEPTLKGSLLTLFARRSVARRLAAAERLLPAGYHLLVFDVYRPYKVQQSLYTFYKQRLIEQRPELRGQALEAEIQRYVSLPSQDMTRPAPHSTGGAVDLAIVRLDKAHEKELRRIRELLTDDSLYVARRIGLEMRLSAIMRQHARMLDFGTAFDHGGEQSALAYYEAKIAAGETLSDSELQASNNRRLLYKVMTQAGFQPYFAEWWHFNAPETQMGAAAAGIGQATFGAADLSADNLAHEAMRQRILADTLKLQATEVPAVVNTALETELRAVVDECGDIRTVAADWPVEIMAPAEV